MNINTTTSRFPSPFAIANKAARLLQSTAFVFCLVANSTSKAQELFSLQYDTICTDTPVLFDFIASDYDTWDWDFGNGQHSMLQQPETVTYENAGIFNISLKTTKKPDQCALTSVHVRKTCCWTQDFLDDDFFEPNAELFIKVKDTTATEVFCVSHVFGGNPPNTIPTPGCFLSNSTLRAIEIWDDDTNFDDFLHKFFVVCEDAGRTLTSPDGQHEIRFEVEQPKDIYEWTVPIFVTKPYITGLDSMLTAHVDGVDLSLATIQWFRNDTLLPNSNTLTLHAPLPGSYSVEIIGPDCLGKADAFPWSCAEREGLDGTAPVVCRMYPNPFRTGEVSLLIASRQAEKAVVEMVNPAGQVVFKKNIGVQSGETQALLEAGFLAAGLYLVRLKGDGFCWDGKLVKVR